MTKARKSTKTPLGDTRPYEAYDPDKPEEHVMRCWYESTAKEYCKITGMKWRKREVAA